jgi:GAF domain-containing protein
MLNDLDQQTLTGTQLTPEMLVPMLGEYLIEQNLITHDNLQRALEYQQKKASLGQPRLLGKILIELGMMDRETLDKVITGQILALQNALKINNNQLIETVERRNSELKQQSRLINHSVEISRQLFSTKTSQEVQYKVTKFLVNHLGYQFAAIYLLADDNDRIIAVCSHGVAPQNYDPNPVTLSQIPFLGEAISIHNAQIRLDEQGQDELDGQEQPIQYHRVAIPLLIQNQAIGGIDIIGGHKYLFEPVGIGVLQVIANQVAASIQALERLTEAQDVLNNVEKKLLIAQTLDTVNRSITSEIDLNQLYQIVHQQISRVIGEVNFLIAIYDPLQEIINVPYAYEDRHFIKLPPLPLGEGLTSILIHSKKPLMLVEDTERQAALMGAKTVGKPAKSWLGLPMLIAGEAIGAVILQDSDSYNRFSQEDQDFMLNITSQVAIAIRNARLLEQTQRQAQREKLLYEITNKIRSTLDMQSIINITAQELTIALGSNRTRVEVGGGFLTPELGISHPDDVE